MCSRSVTTALSRTPGVYSANVNLVSETADVLFNPKVVDVDELGDKINSIGFEYLGVHDNNSLNNDAIDKKHKDMLNQKLYRIVVGFFFSALIMYLMFANIDLGSHSDYIILA